MLRRQSTASAKAARRTRLSGGVVLAVSALLGGCATQGQPLDASPVAYSAPEQLRIGVSLPSYHYDPTAVAAWEKESGHRADVVQTFVPWLYEESPDLTAFPSARARQISQGGRVLEVTWTPAEPSEGNDRPGIDLASIADGDHDAYVRRFARDIRDSGLTVRLRFAHEMNGRWSRWSESSGDNASGDYVRAWRHLHDVFAEEGAAEVAWVWSPNVVGDSTQALSELYPGDAYVDEIGIDGYSYPKAGCLAPGPLFDPTLSQVHKLSQRPVALAEVGVDAQCPDRAAWVSQLFDWAEKRDLVGVTWWERAGGDDDYRITGSGDTLTALRRAVQESSQ